MKKISCFALTLILTQLSYAQSAQPTSPLEARGDQVIQWAHALNLQAWTSYSASIKSCTAGTFVLINPLVIAGAFMDATMGSGNTTQDQFNQTATKTPMTYQIIGLENGKCHVKMSIPATDELPPPQGNAKNLDCAIPQESLNVISQAAQIIASVNIKNSDSNGAADDASAKILASACVQSTGQ